jgi:hypothetical protein
MTSFSSPDALAAWSRPADGGSVSSEASDASMKSGFGARWIGQSPDPTLEPGDVASLVVFYLNSGARPWVGGLEDAQAELGVTGGADTPNALRWGWLSADRPAAQWQSHVAPGEVATFLFAVRAPQKPGTYALSLRPVIGGSTWLDDETSLVITVRR